MKTADALLELLRENPQMTLADVAAAVGRSVRAVDGKNDPGLLAKISPPQSQDLAHDSVLDESWSSAPMPR